MFSIDEQYIPIVFDKIYTENELKLDDRLKEYYGIIGKQGLYTILNAGLHHMADADTYLPLWSVLYEAVDSTDKYLFKDDITKIVKELDKEYFDHICEYVSSLKEFTDQV